MTRITRSRLRFSLAILALLSTLILAACGGTAANTSNPSSDHVTLTFGWWSNGPQHDQQFAAWAQSFTRTHPNITIKSEFLPFGDYFTKLQTTAAAGDAYCSVKLHLTERKKGGRVKERENTSETRRPS